MTKVAHIFLAIDHNLTTVKPLHCILSLHCKPWDDFTGKENCVGNCHFIGNNKTAIIINPLQHIAVSPCNENFSDLLTWSDD